MQHYHFKVKQCIISECVEGVNKNTLASTTININKHGNGYIKMLSLNKERAMHFANRYLELHKNCRI